MSLRSATMSRKAAHSDTTPAVDLSSIPEEYHKFVHIFSKKKADTLPPHRSYDLKIELEEGAKLYTPPPVPGRILPSPGVIPGFLVDSGRNEYDLE